MIVNQEGSGTGVGQWIVVSG